MTISQSDLMRQAHERVQTNQPKIRRRINSSLSGLFGTGLVATVAAAGVDALPWWVAIIVAVALAVAEVLSQAFSKGPITPSQADRLAAAVDELEAEANPEPSPLEQRVSELAGAVETVAHKVGTLVETHDLEAQAAQVATQPDPAEVLRAEAEAHLR